MTDYNAGPNVLAELPEGNPGQDSDLIDRLASVEHGTRTPPVDGVALIGAIGVVLKERGIVSPDGVFLGFDHDNHAKHPTT